MIIERMDTSLLLQTHPILNMFLYRYLFWNLGNPWWDPFPLLPAHTAWENSVITFPKTNRLPLKNRAWETRFLFGDNGLLGVLLQEWISNLYRLGALQIRSESALFASEVCNDLPSPFAAGQNQDDLNPTARLLYKGWIYTCFFVYIDNSIYSLQPT